MRFDHAFVGAGIAGSSLALRLAERGARILLVDPVVSDTRTFGFWADRPTPFDDLTRSWARLRVVGPDGDVTAELGSWRYRMLEAGQIRDRAAEAVLRSGGTVLRAPADAVIDGADEAAIVVGTARHAAAWVYDSRPARPVGESLRLEQSFRGVWVVTETDAFDPETATLMDFRTPQVSAGVRFFYAMPVTARRALVMGVCMGPRSGAPDPAAWLADRGVAATVEREEHASTTLTDGTFPRRLGRRVLAIGVAGGMLKASTGYALVRIQRDADRVVDSLERHGHPFGVRPSRWIWRFLDAVLLRALAHRGGAMVPAFEAMFARNPIDRVLRFLDERSSLWEGAALVATLPFRPFLSEAIGWVGRPLLPDAQRSHEAG